MIPRRRLGCSRTASRSSLAADCASRSRASYVGPTRTSPRTRAGSRRAASSTTWHPNELATTNATAEGTASVTHYDLIEAYRSASLLDIKLETGRTHQIRVHMSAHRHPCVGDLTYGADPTLAKRLGLTRQWLHAVRLGFEHPGDGSWVEFSSTYPEDLQKALDRIASESQ